MMTRAATQRCCVGARCDNVPKRSHERSKRHCFRVLPKRRVPPSRMPRPRSTSFAIGVAGAIAHSSSVSAAFLYGTSKGYGCRHCSASTKNRQSREHAGDTNSGEAVTSQSNNGADERFPPHLMAAFRDVQPRRPKHMPNIKRVRSVSDIHTDYKANFEWAQSLKADPDCLLIVAGDVSHETPIIRKTLQILRRKFGAVSFTPGNHDLWIEHGFDNSIEKLVALLKLCDDIDVETGPVRIGDTSKGLWVTPLLSWHHQSFDTEPDIDPKCWGRIPSVEKLVADFRRARWPEPLSPRDDSVACWVDGINDYILGDLSETMNDGSPILTFSHFLPRLELNPEKRYMNYPTLNKAIGSVYVERRLRAMNSSFHIFGHTHFGWDAELPPGNAAPTQSFSSSNEPLEPVQNVRYVQCVLAYPKEWEFRSRSLSVGTMSEEYGYHPVCVWEQDEMGESNGFPDEPLGGYWSDRYYHVERTPEIIDALPPWNAARFQQLEGGRIENYVRHNSTRFDKF